MDKYLDLNTLICMSKYGGWDMLFLRENFPQLFRALNYGSELLFLIENADRVGLDIRLIRNGSTIGTNNFYSPSSGLHYEGHDFVSLYKNMHEGINKSILSHKIIPPENPYYKFDGFYKEKEVLFDGVKIKAFVHEDKYIKMIEKQKCCGILQKSISRLDNILKMDRKLNTSEIEEVDILTNYISIKQKYECKCCKYS